MLAVVIVLSLVPQLYVEPSAVEVGEDILVFTNRAGEPVPGIEVSVEIPDGTLRACGPTAADGALYFRAEEVGRHVFVATVEGVRCLRPAVVSAARRRWLLALGAVPLGLALLWRNLSRLRDRRGP